MSNDGVHMRELTQDVDASPWRGEGDEAQPVERPLPEFARHFYSGCPICDSRHFDPYIKGDARKHPLYCDALPETIAWMRCQVCDHIFTAGYWTDVAFNLILSKTPEHQRVGRDAERQRWINARIVERMAQHAPADGFWYDVGFGDGSLMMTAREFGFRPCGSDLRKDNVSRMLALGFGVSSRRIELEPAHERFDVISMADLIEHVPYPIDTIRAAHRLLTPGGKLFLSTPNRETAVWHAMGEANPYWFEIEHYHIWSRETMADFLESQGFRIIHYAVSERYLSGMELICRKL